MDNKFQDVRATGVQGNDATQQSASFGYGQVIPAAPVLPATPPVQPAAAPAPPIPPVSPPPQPSVEPAITPTTPPTPPPAPRPRTPLPWKKILKYTAFVALGLLVLGGLWLAYNAFTSNKKEAGQVASRFDSVQIPLEDFINQDGLTLLGTRSLIVNGPLLANDGFTISPSTQPSNAQRGQIYFDANNNELAYFNGAQFVPVAGTTNIVRSISGFSGQVTLGQGLNGANGQISNSGVLSLQGQTGNVTLIGGAGIAVNGTTLSNTGVTSLGGTTGDITVGTGLTITPDKQLQNAGVVSATAGSGITVTNDGAGNITISNSGAGSGTVQSPGGTAGRIAKFTGVQTIEDSLLSESGATVTVNGSLSTTSNAAVGGSLTLGTALTVGNGGTGATSLANNGVLIGQGAGALTAVTAGGSGLCLMSTAGAPAFSACPGGSGVTSLNGLTGALTVANASAAGSTITINDASTSQKGIAQFNGTNFSASSGTINTIQDINTTAAPTFARLSLTSSEASSAMLLVNNTNVGATGNLLDVQLNGSSRFAVSPAGAVTVASTINGQTISSAASFTGTLAVAGSASLNGGASVIGTLNANTITPTGSLTIGATGQSFLLQGNASSSITATNGASTTSLTFQTPTANVSYRFPTVTAGTYDVCSTSGNCAGVGGGVTTPGGTIGTLAKFTAGQVIGDSLLSESGSVVTVNGNLNLTTGNQFRINGTQISSANLSNDANLAKLDASQTFTGNTLVFQNGINSATAFSVQNAAGVRAFTVDTSGAQIVLGQSSSLNGTLVFANSSNTNTTTLTAATPSASRSIVLPNESGTVCTTGSVCTGYAPGSGSGNYIHNTTTPQTANIAIRSANDADITVHIKQRPTQTADFIRVDDTNDVAVYNLDTFGNAHYAHKIDVAGAAAFGAAADTGIAVKVVTQADSQIGLQVSGINSGQTGDIMQLLGPGSRSLTYAANGTVALKGGTLQSTDLLQIQNSSGDVLSLFNASGQLTLGRIAASGTTQAGSLKFADGTNSNFSVTLGTTTLSANRTITLPNVSGTVCLDSGNCASTATLQTAYNNGNSITTTDNRNITFNLADTATDSNFLVNLQCTTTCSTNGRFAVQNSGTDVFAVSPNGGNVLFKNSTNAVTGFQIQNSSAGSVFNVDTSNNRVGINNSAPAADFDVGPTGLAIGQIVQGRFGDLILQSQEAGANGITASTNRGSNGNLTLDGASGSSLFLSPFTTNNNYLAAGGGKVRVGNSSAPVYTLDVTGDTNTSGAYRIGGVTICTSSGCTASAASAIQNQNAAQQTSANFWISGTGRADTALQAPLFDRATAGALAIGTTNATSIAMQQDTTFASGKTLTLQGAFAMQPALDSTSALNVKTSLGNNIFTIDTTNGRVGIGLSASNLPTLANEGLEIRGALRLSGSADSISDLYTTPLGNTVDTMINILNYDPGGSGQLIAMGLPSTANSTSRAITLLDARAGAHQPTLAVLSPNENQIGGFSWDGSNTDFFIKNSEAAGKIASNIGGTNRLVVTNAGIGVNMTPVDAAVDVTTASTSQVGLKVTGVSGQTADVLQLDVTGVGRVVSVNNGGASTFQNYSNSTTAFRVLNSASVPQFVVDASNSRMYIGNPTGDTTGALLVLDTKTSAGDPTGVNGGMYYNSSLGKMRCYENSAWNDCISTTRTSYRYDNDFITTAGDSVISIQDSGAGASHTNIASIAGHQGIIRLATGTTTTGWSNVGTNDPGQAYYFGSENIQLETVVRINNLSDGTETFTSRIGFADSVTTDGTDGCFFRYTHSVQSGNWQGVCVKAGVTTTCNTTVAVAAGSWYRLTVNVNAAATAAVFTVNGTTSCTVASGIPSGAGEESSLNINLVKSAGTTSRTMDVDYMEIQTQYPASR
ncbi:MAG TPA: hypothetical protein VFO38_04375 [Candidatus Saccharimonadales bacterium]|nr:hypothetical protein [Candidatus Saccharimonadales bacterium]